MVEKGKKINPEEVIKIYGEEPRGRGKGGLGLKDLDRKYNITDNHFNPLK